MLEHETLVLLSHKRQGEVLALGNREVQVVEPTGTEKRVLLQSADEKREVGSIEIEGGTGRIILFGRPSSIPKVLFKIGIKELNPQPGAVVFVSHSHWEPDSDIRPSDEDLSCAQELQGVFPNLSLKYRVVCGNPNEPIAFQYFPVP